MKRNIIFTIILGIFLIMNFTLAQTTESFNNDIWRAIADLHNQIDNIELTPGPPGADGQDGVDAFNVPFDNVLFMSENAILTTEGVVYYPYQS